MTFELFKKGSAPISGVPSVTIQKRGLVSLNDAASKLLNDPSAVHFLWDPEARMIALKPVPIEDPDAYPVREQIPAKARPGGRRGAALIAGSTFTKFIGIDTSVARRWIPKLSEGMLLIDLKEEGQVVVANRNRGKGASGADEGGDE